MDFRPLDDLERTDLLQALRGNVAGTKVLLTDRADTSYAGTATDVPDDQVIHAIKSIPSHY